MARGQWAALAVLVLSANGRAAAAGDAAAGRTTTVLNEGSFWRYHVTLRKPTVSAGAGRAGAGGESIPVVLPVQVPYRSYPGIEHMETPAPPADWTRRDFDDADWPRARAASRWADSIAVAAFPPAVRYSVAVLCMRGKFAVRDPSAVEALTLSLRYRGGVVVYLNGREVARKDVPAGPPDANTPAAPYGEKAFVDADGEPIPGPYHAGKRIKAGEKGLARRIARRDRALGPLTVPRGILRSGVNVLAVELHRSGYHPSAMRWFRRPHVGKQCAWTPIGLTQVRLGASGTGAALNVARPRGLHVWNEAVSDRVTALDHGDPGQSLRPISIAAARNGAFSARVVVGSREAIRDLRARASDLESAGGRIGASRVQVRFARLDGRSYQHPDWFDGLEDRPPAEVPVHKTGGAVQPVWITVHVARDVPAGEYRGRLTLSARGAVPVTVPVHVSVADWALPDPRDFRTYVGVYQSPATLALQYNVPEWSERHWKLMARSFELLGRLGNKIVVIPLSNRTQFGNDEGMVTWLRKPDGSFEYDLSVLGRYLGLVREHLGAVDFVAIQVWHSRGWQTLAADQQNTVTVIDRRSGRRERMQVPRFGTEQSKRFWKPVLDAVRKRLAAAGLARAMCLGIFSDGTAPPEVLRAFDEIVPGGAKWQRGCHSVTRKAEAYPLKGGGRVVCHEFCYGLDFGDPAEKLPPIWDQRRRPGVAFIRHNFDDRLSLLKYRTMPERALYCGCRGIGRICLDYWDVLRVDEHKRRNLYNRWPHSSCAQREPNLFRLAWPSPDGAAPTVRYVQFREGIQDAEALIAVAEALAKHADRLGPDLAAECRQVLVDRINFCRRTCPEGRGTWFRTYHHGWGKLTARIYAAAAKSARRLAGP